MSRPAGCVIEFQGSAILWERPNDSLLKDHHTSLGRICCSVRHCSPLAPVGMAAAVSQARKFITDLREELHDVQPATRHAGGLQITEGEHWRVAARARAPTTGAAQFMGPRD
jgi:hypothetical protein